MTRLGWTLSRNLLILATIGALVGFAQYRLACEFDQLETAQHAHGDRHHVHQHEDGARHEHASSPVASTPDQGSSQGGDEETCCKSVGAMLSLAPAVAVDTLLPGAIYLWSASPIHVVRDDVLSGATSLFPDLSIRPPPFSHIPTTVLRI